MSYKTLISVAELTSLLSKSGTEVVLLDASHDLFDPTAGRRAYDHGHLPSAQFISMDKDVGGQKTSQNGRHPLPDRSDVVATLQRLGVNNDTQVVVYDNSQGTHASRVWWTLKWLGHHDVAVLDGGIQAWQAAGNPVTKEPPTPVAPGNFTQRGIGMQVATFEDVFENLKTQQKLVVDARSSDRFRGENETLDPKAGHIPGAANRFYRLNLKDDGTFKSNDQLKTELLELIGNRTASELIMQCGSGVSACHNLLALELAGLGSPALYVGSWSEWCSRENAPIATGDA